MPIYHVQLEIDIYVLADSEAEAEAVAIHTAAKSEMPEVALLRQVTSLQEVPDDWKRSIPWGTDDDKTLAELLAPAEPARGTSSTEADQR